MAKIVTLGEIMLRLATTAGERIMDCGTFCANYGGAEANVAISMANFDHSVSFVSKVPENSLGYSAIKHLKSYNVDVSNVLIAGNRMGIYFLESGIGRRASSVVYDRKGSSFSEIKVNDWSDEIFHDQNVFHISGITPALSKEWQTMTIELIQKAKTQGCKISLDINYRSKLWSISDAALFVNQVLPYVDYCSAGILDAKNFLHVSNDSVRNNDLSFYYSEMSNMFPNIEIFYSTKREVISSSKNMLKGTIWRKGEYCESCEYEIDSIIDRIGGGDAFSAGVLHGILSKYDLQKTVDFATASSVLKHTINGDCNQFSVSEIFDFLDADSSKVVR